MYDMTHSCMTWTIHLRHDSFIRIKLCPDSLHVYTTHPYVLICTSRIVHVHILFLILYAHICPVSLSRYPPRTHTYTHIHTHRHRRSEEKRWGSGRTDTGSRVPDACWQKGCMIVCWQLVLAACPTPVSPVSVLQRVVSARCSVLQCVVVWYRVLQCVAVCCSMLSTRSSPVSVLQCVAVCCYALYCDAVWYSVLQYVVQSIVTCKPTLHTTHYTLHTMTRIHLACDMSYMLWHKPHSQRARTPRLQRISHPYRMAKESHLIHLTAHFLHMRHSILVSFANTMSKWVISKLLK